MKPVTSEAEPCVTMTESAKPEFQDDGSEIMAPYQYDPLPTREHTRVLVLEPDPNDDNDLPLVASLRLLDLRDEDSEPFEAISYAWGSPEKTHVIVVDGHRMPITANLWKALAKTRLFDQPRRLWADAICIDQSNDTEKGQQVAAMGQIYKTSKRTLICLDWLDSEFAEDAATLVDEVNTMIRNVHTDPNFSGKVNSFPYPEANDTITSDSRWSSGWAVLLDQPWFRRGWVVQEASLGPDACVLWGSFQIEWTSILRVNHWVGLRGRVSLHSLDGKRPRVVPSAYHFRSFAYRHPEEAVLFDTRDPREELPSTLEMLRDMQKRGLTDPRDRIYASMALDTSDRAFTDLQLEPDYERPFQELYHEFAVKYIETTRALRILSFISHNKETLASPNMAEAIPSWVPRWDVHSGIQSPSQTDEEMSEQPSTFKFSDKYSILRVRGLILGSVEYSAAQELGCRDSPRSVALQKVVSLWKEVVAASSTNEWAYNGRQSLAFFDVLCLARRFGTLEEWSAWRQEFALQLQSYTTRPEPDSTIPILQRSELGEKQLLFETMAYEFSMKAQRFVLLSRGYFGVAPLITQKGDLFALIHGCKSLLILRPVENKPHHYQIIGPVYVESKIVKYKHESNQMGEEGCRDWEEWGLEEQDINLC